MSESARCPQCGAALSPAATAGGQCPACLLKLGLDGAAEAGAPSARSGVTDTAAVTRTTDGALGGTPHLQFAPRRPPPEAGRAFGPYHLHRILGQGGYGVVFEAEHRETQRRVALKVVTAVRAASTEAVARFEREGRLAASINHPRSVFLFGAEAIEGYPAIAMELMPGGTLQVGRRRGARHLRVRRERGAESPGGGAARGGVDPVGAPAAVRGPDRAP